MDEADLTTPYEVSVISRLARETDLPCIFSTWRNSLCYSALNPLTQNEKGFFKAQTQKIKDILARAKTKIACLEDDHDFIVGYVVYTKTHLDYIYVKSDYRNKGIGTLLLPKNIETCTKDLTKLGALLAEKKNLKLQGE